MTTQEMIDAFLLEYDLNGSGAVAGFEDEEIVAFLNKAQKEIVEKVFLEFGPNQIYDTTSSHTGTLTTTVGHGGHIHGEYTTALPTDFMYYINSSVKITRTSKPILTVMTWIKCNIIDNTDTENFMTNALNSMILINPVLFIQDGFIYVIIDSSTVLDTADNLSFRYVKIPLDLDETVPAGVSELSEKWHQDIVNRAVLNAMRITNDFRVRQSQSKSDK